MKDSYQPLAERIRPATLDEVAGQRHILGNQKPLYIAIDCGQIHSMVFWGPPGTGKTTLAKLLADYCDAAFISLSAVLSGVKDIRRAVETAKVRQAANQGKTVLFVDEVHRFNKAQQDAFLPHIEDGTVIFVGATTENPSFELNNALLSRLRVYVLQPLSVDDIAGLIARALKDAINGLGKLNLEMQVDDIEFLADMADGDARRALTFLEIAADLAEDGRITRELISEVVAGGAVRRFDKGGDAFYDQISALHKSVRGSDPDAALYWFCRMVDGGCDPVYIARRVVRMASEDIGNADPRALQISLDAWQVQQRLGSPEGELAIAQAIVYLSVAAKSNAVYTAFNQAMAAAKQSGSLEVPLHLKNAPTRLMKALRHGKEYRYAHDETGAYAAGENYFPGELGSPSFYHPVDRGLEIKIREKLAKLRLLDRQADPRGKGEQ